MIEVLEPGLETTVQDFPGRIGYWGQGLPPSGPVDSWSFRLANILVENMSDAAALECAHVGPTLKFRRDAVIALTGADMAAKLDGEPVPLWQTVPVRAGQVLALGMARIGARTYLAIAGGIATAPWLGSRCSFHQAGTHGIDCGALQSGQVIALGEGDSVVGRRVRISARPPIRSDGRWDIEVCVGPNADRLDAAARERFLATDWTLSATSGRRGFRLESPQWMSAAPRNLQPSGTGDHDYPLGAIHFAGQSPIIQMNDGPGFDGLANPYTVPSAVFWKLGQSGPGDIYRFREISLDAAAALAEKLTAFCSETSIS